MKNGQCPKCLKVDILGNIPLFAPQGLLTVEASLGVARHPDSLIQNIEFATVRAWVCESCGFTEFYANRPEKLGNALDRVENSTKDASTKQARPFRIKRAAETAVSPPQNESPDSV